MNAAAKRTLLWIWAAAACLGGELWLLRNLPLPYRFTDFLPPLMLLLSAAAALLLLLRDGEAAAGRLLLGWAIAVSAIFAAANIGFIAADGSPAALYRGRTLWCSLPLLSLTALSWLLVRTWRKRRAASAGAPRRALAWAVGVCLLLYALWVAGALVYTQSRSTAEDTALSIPAFTLDAGKLDEFLRAQYPADCADMPLTGLRLRAELQDGDLLSGQLYMEYSRRLDDRRAGGNVEAVCFCVDAADGRVVSIERYRGARNARDTGFDAVTETVLRFPYARYIENAAALAETSDDARLQLYCDSNAAGTALSIRPAQSGGGYETYIAGGEAKS